jgi:hypothetical protein
MTMEKKDETPDALGTLAEIRAEAERASRMLMQPGCPPTIRGLTALRNIEIMARDTLTPDSEFSEVESGAA